MNSPTKLTTLPALLTALLLAVAFGACGKGSDAAGPAAGAGEEVPSLEALKVPTQAEADQQAAEEITPENADEEFEKLMKEIQGDG